MITQEIANGKPFLMIEMLLVKMMLMRAYSCKRPPLVATTALDFQGGRLREL